MTSRGFLLSLGGLLFLAGAAFGLRHLPGTSGQGVASAREPALTLSSRVLDFGEVPPDGRVMRSLVVRNDGSEPVVARFASQQGKFRIEPQELVLHPGVPQRVAVAVEGGASGSLDDELQIRIDGYPDAPLVVALEARPSKVRQLARRSSAVAPAEEGPDAAASPDPDSRPVATPLATGTLFVPPSAVASHQAGAATVAAATDDPAGGEVRRPLAPAVRPPEPWAAGVSMSFVGTAAPAPAGAISAEEASTARPVPSQIREDDADEPPAERERRRRRLDEPALRMPTLSIGPASNVRLIGSANTFYPQSLPVLAAAEGGPLTIAPFIRFPQIDVGLGQNVEFRQVGAAAGTVDPASGEMRLRIPLETVDINGNAAPLPIELSSGTVLARNDDGSVFSMTGQPWARSGGRVVLVAIAQIPQQFRHNAELHLVFFEIEAYLDLGTPAIPDPGNG